jgi:hypothetical protein
MPRKTVVCPECGKPVPSGRLACPACGSLVAAVTGPSRRSTKTVAGGARTVSVPAQPALRTGLAPASDHATNGTGSEPDATPTITPARTAAQLLGASQPMQPSKQRSAALGPNIPSVLSDWPPKPPRTLDDPTGREIEDVHSSGWGAAPTAAGAVSAPPSLATPVKGAYVPPSIAAAAGSPYLAPSNVFNAATPGGPAPVGPPAASAASPTDTTPQGVPSSDGRATARPEKPLRPGSASLFADLPFDAPSTLIDWLMALGTGAATIGFLLPWSGVVIGAASVGGSYMETWGIASPAHLLVLLVSVVGFLTSVLPNRVPAWLRTSVLGLVLGGVLVGLAWPYMFAAGFGYKVGVIVEIVGALVLIVAGVLSILPSRHDSESRSV